LVFLVVEHSPTNLSPVIAVYSPDLALESLHLPTQHIYMFHMVLTINSNISLIGVNRLATTIIKHFTKRNGGVKVKFYTHF
jgi:hypothetical protein